MKIKDAIILLSIAVIFYSLGAFTTYQTSTKPAIKLVLEALKIEKTAINNEYKGKIKSRDGGEVLLDVNSSINDTIKKKWRLFGK